MIGPDHGLFLRRGAVGVDHRWQRRVGDLDHLRRIARLGIGLRDHHGDRLSDMARPVRRQRKMRGNKPVGSIPVFEHDIGWTGKPHIVWDRAKVVGQPVGAGQHIYHARRCFCSAGIDIIDVRMGMYRRQHKSVKLTLRRIVVGEPAAAGQQPKVFLPPG